MPAFLYRAVDQSGAKQRGVLEAASPLAARRQLRERGLLPVSIGTASSASSGDRQDILARFRRPATSARALATVTRQLSTLISSDVNVEEALRLVAGQAESAALSSLLLDVRGAILDGRSFANALAAHPGVFPQYYRASVAAGEHSGKLAAVLAHLAEFVEARYRNQRKIQLALLYPALLAAVSMAMMALLLVYVVPDIVRVFISRGAELPLLTRALIALSAGLQRYGPALAVILVGAAWLGQRWLVKPANRLRLDTLLSRTPPFARFNRDHNAARFAGTLATLIQSAVPLVDALAAAAAVTPNHHFRANAQTLGKRVSEGASLQAAMADAGVFPSMLVALVASGENSGKLGAVLARAATELERELDALVATLVSLVEPAVLLLMGGLVLLMVLAILLPIIGLNNLVGM